MNKFFSLGRCYLSGFFPLRRIWIVSIGAILLLAIGAPKLPLTLVVVTRPEITTQRQIEIFEQALPIVKQVGTKVVIKKVVETEDTLRRNDLKYYWSRLFSWSKWGRKNGLHPANHVHYLLPPVYSGEIDYGGGAAGATCTTTRNKGRRFSYSVIREKNLSGEDRTVGSVVSSGHELLHVLGANHIDSKPNIMRSYYTVSSSYPVLLPLTKRQVQYCRDGKTPLGN